MARPSISQLNKVLREQDWQWSPYFRTTPLKAFEIERVISEFYSALDRWVESVEDTIEAPETETSSRQGSSEGNHSREQAHSQAKQDCENYRQRARDALVTYTHAGLRKPFAVRHRRLLRNQWVNVIGLFRRHTKLWYFAIAWQFGEWYDHVLEVYEGIQDRQLENQYREASERYEGSLGEAIASHILGEQIDLIEERLESLLDGEEQEWYHKELFLDVWLHLRGIELDSSEKDEVLGWTFNRFGNDS